jgi:phospholipase/carboxylesterase
MPDPITTRRDDRPTEGFHTTLLSAYPDRPVRLFLPADYQPKYAYPLVVLFHPDGVDEDSAARLVPGLSRRNYIAACPRASVPLGPGPTGRSRFQWGNPGRDDYLPAALAHVRTEYNIHAERIYLIGIGEGAAIAYRLGLSMARDIAGIVALNGRLASPPTRWMVRRKALRGLRVFVGHGTHNPVVPVATARRDTRLLENAGADIRFAAYPSTQRLHADMLREVNRWIMGGVTPDQE